MTELQATVRLIDLIGTEVVIKFAPWNLYINGILTNPFPETGHKMLHVETADYTGEISFHYKDVKNFYFTEDGKFTIELEWGESS